MRNALHRVCSAATLTAGSAALLALTGSLVVEASPPQPKSPQLVRPDPEPLVPRPRGTLPLVWEGDIAARMVAGIERWLDAEIVRVLSARAPDTGPPEVRSLRREKLARLLGVVRPQPPQQWWNRFGGASAPSLIAQTPRYTVHALRWEVLDGLEGEGLLLQPVRGQPTALVVVIPDADQTPEQWVGLAAGLPEESQLARRLAEQGLTVLVPALINRDCTLSGSPELKITTNQSHREFLHRAAYQMGRTLTGLELQKILTALDRFHARAPETPMAVFGYGEGGLLALLAGALDTRIAVTVVSGYFGVNDAPWEQPLYRNIWGGLRGFTDLELAELVSARPLIVERARGPSVPGPTEPRPGVRRCAAPGRLDPDGPAQYDGDERARAFHLRGYQSSPADQEGRPGSSETLSRLLTGLSVKFDLGEPVPDRPTDIRPHPEREEFAEVRHRRQFAQLLEYTQRLLRLSERVRADYWRQADARSAESWTHSSGPYRTRLWEEVIGRLPPERGWWCFPPRPGPSRSRLIYNQPKWTGYEVIVPVRGADIFAYGILLLPKDIKLTERRPVVVCQHGLEGRPSDLCGVNVTDRARAAYADFAARLADRGFVVYAPQNPYIGGDKFRLLQRKANPLGLSLFSFIIEQHAAHLKWLAEQPFVDAERIGFYGLSYGGKTAMRVPAVLPGYALSICSGDFNEWIHKNVSVDLPSSYLFTGEYEMPEWNLGNTFNYAEMASLIFPRPFLVERGHSDAVGRDEWVAYEFAKVRRHYAQLGQSDRAEIEFFVGGHTINGQASFRFLHRWLHWPEPRPERE